MLAHGCFVYVLARPGSLQVLHRYESAFSGAKDTILAPGFELGLLCDAWLVVVARANVIG